MNQKDEGIKWYNKSIEINPNNPFSFNNLGCIYIDKNEY